LELLPEGRGKYSGSSTLTETNPPHMGLQLAADGSKQALQVVYGINIH
jgi:hypothetical protein